MSDKLIEVKNKKLINIGEFAKLAKKVIKSIQEQRDYLKERSENNGNNNSPRTYSIS